MGLLKRKAEANDTLSIRMPASAKREVLELRSLAEEKGFDLTGSLTDAVLAWVKRVRKELTRLEHKRESLSASEARGAVLNGSGE
jgi:hypothetical protein